MLITTIGHIDTSKTRPTPAGGPLTFGDPLMLGIIGISPGDAKIAPRSWHSSLLHHDTAGGAHVAFVVVLAAFQHE